MKSQYPSSHACYTCGSTWKIGDEINKKTKKKKDGTEVGYWCSNPDCGNTETKQETFQNIPDIEESQQTKKADPLTTIFVKNQNILLDIIEQGTEQHYRDTHDGRTPDGAWVRMREKIIWDALNKK